ncbi:MAG: methionine--tRNA ligase [Cyclobacteriaceae bacterium]|nr:MAG: methionine--tRNA ligase [Cyclobacteriaceae bacterium]
MSFKRFTITAALPYANGPVHIGHLAGVYVPADIYVRYMRLQEKDVLFICGSDELGVPITLRAKKEGISPQDVVDRYHAMIAKSFEEFGISFDHYSRTSSPVHWETSSEFFKKLYQDGVFTEESSKQYFDEESQQFLADRYIQGTCPNCGFAAAYGDQCEHCGSSLSPTDLKQPKSMLSGKPPVLKETKHWYLPMDQYENWLRKYILEDHREWKTNVYGQCKSWIDQGLKPRAMTRDLDWGVPVPLEEAKGKVLYVWFDAPIGYISATKEWAKANNRNWEPYWKDSDTRLIHFIGKDNIVFHCIIFPVILKAHGDYILPDNVPANEFLNLEGDKISTSRNWAVWLHEFLEELPGKQDVLRYVLCANAPETKDNDFTWKEFQARNNNELVAIFGNFINRAVVLTHKYFDGQVPPMGKTNDLDTEILDRLAEYPVQIGGSLENFKFREALNQMMDVARMGNKYLADTEPWKVIKQDKQRVGTILNLSLQIAANLSILADPFLPRTCEKLRAILGIDKLKWADSGKQNLLQTGNQLENAALLFEKIEDSVVEQQIEKLKASKLENNPDQQVQTRPQKPEITFDDFLKLDIRIGKVVSAEKVAKSKKLLKLVVDTGLEERVIVSGIAQNYTPEQAVGQTVTVLLNLMPRKIMGIESQGMILMAEDADGRFGFLQPDKEVKPGGEVS